MARRRRREYLQLLDASKAAVELAIDCYNRVHNPYKNESTLILLTNAWELLAKASLLRKQKPIGRGKGDETISAEVAVARVRDLKLIDKTQFETVQQIISLRHAAIHHVLPPVPDEVMHHLLFYGCKFYRELVVQVFPTHAKDLASQFLTLSFSDHTTYADKVQRSISRSRRSPADQQLVWLLERGVAFDGSSYLTQKQVAAKYKGKRHIAPYLSLSEFVREADMVRIVPVEAPKNYTADVTLRKGSPKNSTLPVIVKKTDPEADFPYLTNEIAEKLGKNLNWTAKTIGCLGLKVNPKYHQEIRTSRSGGVHRYSEAALESLKTKLRNDPDFNPWA